VFLENFQIIFEVFFEVCQLGDVFYCAGFSDEDEFLKIFEWNAKESPNKVNWVVSTKPSDDTFTYNYIRKPKEGFHSLRICAVQDKNKIYITVPIQGKMVIYEWDPKTKNFTFLNQEGCLTRTNYSLNYVNIGPKRRLLVMIGGLKQMVGWFRPSCDIVFFNVDTEEWEGRPFVLGDAFTARYDQAVAVLDNGNILIHGGRTPWKSVNEVSVLDIYDTPLKKGTNFTPPNEKIEYSRFFYFGEYKNQPKKKDELNFDYTKPFSEENKKLLFMDRTEYFVEQEKKRDAKMEEQRKNWKEELTQRLAREKEEKERKELEELKKAENKNGKKEGMNAEPTEEMKKNEGKEQKK